MSNHIQLTTTSLPPVTVQQYVSPPTPVSAPAPELVQQQTTAAVGSDDDNNKTIPDQDRFVPIANVQRIMKRFVPERCKLSKEVKEAVQEAASEFILFIASEAAEKCADEKRKTITGDDILFAFDKLGFDHLHEVMSFLLKRYRDANRPDRQLSGSRECSVAAGDGMDTSSGGGGGMHEMHHHQPAMQDGMDCPSLPMQAHAAMVPEFAQQPAISLPTSEEVHSVLAELPSHLQSAPHIIQDQHTMQYYMVVKHGQSAGLTPIDITLSQQPPNGVAQQ